MAGPSQAPCTAWATWEQAIECHPDDAPELEESQREAAVMEATGLLQRLGLNAGAPHYGVCSITVRPCRSCTCGSCDACDCVPYYEIKLTQGPIVEVTEVLVDGQPFDDWFVDDWAQLVRSDSEAWPYCQDRAATGSQPGIFSVTYTYGLVPPADAVAACAELAYQLALAKCGDKRCKLPERLRTITREGVTISIVDKMDFLEKGMTGIYEVDLWLSSFRSKTGGGGIMHPGMIRQNRVSHTAVP